MIYFLHTGQVYCGRHFAEVDGHRCSGCDEVSIESQRVFVAKDIYIYPRKLKQFKVHC